MSRSVVAVVKTSPDTVLEDVARAMRLANYSAFLPKEKETALKINISWHHYYPACSTTPWQLEGVIKTLLDDGYDRESLWGAHNRTVVVSARTVSQVSVDVTSEYTPNDARFCPTGAPAS